MPGLFCDISELTFVNREVTAKMHDRCLREAVSVLSPFIKHMHEIEKFSGGPYYQQVPSICFGAALRGTCSLSRPHHTIITGNQTCLQDFLF